MSEDALRLHSDAIASDPAFPTLHLDAATPS
jgi:hypothetical protein